MTKEKKLGDLRRGYATSGSAIDRAAVGLTEGGGACLFREGAKLKGGKLAAMTARAMKVIYDDEKDHCRVMAREAAALIKSAKDLRRMKATARDISRQRVTMRNEMFRRPMTDPVLHVCQPRRVHRHCGRLAGVALSAGRHRGHELPGFHLRCRRCPSIGGTERMC
jgi:hypothetical protein